jgi:hypothetical protein
VAAAVSANTLCTIPLTGLNRRGDGGFASG